MSGGRGWDPRCSAVREPYFQVGSIAELGLGQGLEGRGKLDLDTPPERLREVERRNCCAPRSAGWAPLPVPPLVAAAQFLGGRRRLDPVSVDTAEHFATHLAATYFATPPAGAASGRGACLHTAGPAHTRLADASDKGRIEAIAADQACLAGGAHGDGGRFAQAGAWFAEALRLGRQAGDRRLEACVFGCHATTPLYGPKPDPAAALEALEAAAALHLYLPPQGQTPLFARLALACASAGDDLGSGRLLEWARTVASRVRGGGAG